MKRYLAPNLVLIVTILVSACNMITQVTLTETPPNVTPETNLAIETEMAEPLIDVDILSVKPGEETEGEYLRLSSGGDVDTIVVEGSRKTGGGAVLPAEDGNSTADSYMQFEVDDRAFFEGQPTTSIRVDIDYLDDGTDTFVIQYDALEGGPYGDGRFKETRPEVKRGTGIIQRATFVLKDVNFANRDNNADFRIADMGDGAETVRQVRIILLPMPEVIQVDSCGANPFDELPDSEAIQDCIDKAKMGDIVLFSSGENTPGYRGYLIDRTIFLSTGEAEAYQTFTSSEADNPALLQATKELKGFVMKLFARSLGVEAGKLDYLTLSHLHLDGNRAERECLGEDGVANGVDDNWGSYLAECNEEWDPWCNPGGLDLPGAADWNDRTQSYESHLDRWTTGLLVEGMHITEIECGTAFGMGGAGAVLIGNVIENAGDHVHATGCSQIDDQEGVGDWSDGITFDGPAHQLLFNTVVNPSDVGIVYFGGKRTVIRGNTVQVTDGNHGAFAGIAVHPWALGDVSYGQVVDNMVSSEGDSTCGGLHVGINLGGHMWGGGCIWNSDTPTVGLAGCLREPSPPRGASCPTSGQCQVWAYVPEAATYMMTGNRVRGAHINYLIEGIDFQGTFIERDNQSETPRLSDWGAARTGCEGVVWGALDKVAHHPSLEGWTNLLIHCER